MFFLDTLHTSGDEDPQHIISKFCNELKIMFHDDGPGAPAKISPLRIVVETNEWKVSNIRAPSFPQSSTGTERRQ